MTRRAPKNWLRVPHANAVVAPRPHPVAGMIAVVAPSGLAKTVDLVKIVAGRVETERATCHVRVAVNHCVRKARTWVSSIACPEKTLTIAPLRKSAHGSAAAVAAGVAVVVANVGAAQDLQPRHRLRPVGVNNPRSTWRVPTSRVHRSAAAAMTSGGTRRATVGIVAMIGAPRGSRASAVVVVVPAVAIPPRDRRVRSVRPNPENHARHENRVDPENRVNRANLRLALLKPTLLKPATPTPGRLSRGARKAIVSRTASVAIGVRHAGTTLVRASASRTTFPRSCAGLRGRIVRVERGQQSSPISRGYAGVI